MSKTFTKKDFNSGDGMLTTAWGPQFWFILHNITFNYPVNPTKDDIDHYYSFFKTLRYVLPCRHCRENIVKNMKTLKFSKKIFINRETLSKWVYELHNHVNTMLGKKVKISFHEVRCMHENFRARCDLKKTTNELKCTKKSTSGGGRAKNKTEKNSKKKKEKGCTDSFYGVKTKCCIKFVPLSSKQRTITVDPKCVVKKNA